MTYLPLICHLPTLITTTLPHATPNHTPTQHLPLPPLPHHYITPRPSPRLLSTSTTSLYHYHFATTPATHYHYEGPSPFLLHSVSVYLPVYGFLKLLVILWATIANRFFFWIPLYYEMATADFGNNGYKWSVP